MSTDSSRATNPAIGTFGSFLGLLQTSIIDANTESNTQYINTFLRDNFTSEQVEMPVSKQVEMPVLKKSITAYRPQAFNFNISKSTLDEPNIISIPKLTMGQHNHVKIQDINIETTGQLYQPNSDNRMLEFRRAATTSRSTNDKVTIRLSLTDPPESVSALIDQYNNSSV